MDADSSRKARIEALYDEIDRIHCENREYWKSGEAATSGARAAYQQRMDRLEEIRAELVKLESVS